MNENGIYDAKELGTPKMLLLGLQHMFAMFGATVLVPILVNTFFHGEGLSIQVTLFCAGMGTLLFHIMTKLQVPAFLGSSFAFLGGFATVAELKTGIFANMTYGEKLPYACGGVFVAGLLYLILASIIRIVGINRVMRFLPPVVTAPIVVCIGLGLAPVAISSASTNWTLALISIFTIVFFLIWGKGMLKIIPILLAIIVSYCIALLMHTMGCTNPDGSAILNFTNVVKAPLVGVPDFFLCKFDVTAILAMAPIALASMMEHIGDMSAISATCKRNYIEKPGLHLSLLGDGLATSLSALIGGPANTTYGENTSVLALSRVYDPKVVRIAACYAVALSFLPKIAAMISSMPASIIGGISFILYGMIAAVGMRNLVENKVDMTVPRNLVIIAVVMVAGLGFTKGLTFTVGGTSITLTSLALASILGIILNAILPSEERVMIERIKKE